MEFIKNLSSLYIEKSSFFLELIYQHLLLSFTAIIIAAIVGIILGIVISENEKLASPIMGITNFLYTIPSIAILGILISISGIGNTTAIITLSIYGLLPIVTNTYTGIKNIDPKIIEAGEGMGSTRCQLLYKIKLPLALPVIFSGFRNMVIMTIALCGIASFIGAGGLGVAIWRGITTNNSYMTFAGSLLIAIIALLIDSILRRIQAYIAAKASGERTKVMGLYRNNKIHKKIIDSIVIIIFLLILVLSLIYSNKSSNTDTIVIGSKPMTEQYIITEIIGQLIEEKTDLRVEYKKGIGGGTANIHPAMVNGEIDIYPEYTGTSWEYVLKNKPISDKDELYKQLQKEYSEKYNLNWLGLYGYNNTYALVIDSKIAEEKDINTYSDLAKVSDNLTLGAEYDFYEREDGYNALAKVYGFNFNKTVDLDIALKYQALSSNKVDVINAGSTDAQIKEDSFKVLIDDKDFFPSYYAGTIVRQDVLDEYRELESVLKLLDNNISEEEIIEMNYKVEIENKEDSQVAREFLIKKGLIK